MPVIRPRKQERTHWIFCVNWYLEPSNGCSKPRAYLTIQIWPHQLGSFRSRASFSKFLCTLKLIQYSWSKPYNEAREEVKKNPQSWCTQINPRHLFNYWCIGAHDSTGCRRVHVILCHLILSCCVGTWQLWRLRKCMQRWQNLCISQRKVQRK